MVQEEEAAAGVGLVVGNYCHDVLFQDGRLVGESLGGAASFISNVFDHALDHHHHLCYVSKVGPDFADQLSHSPLSSSLPTTLFHAYFSTSSNDDASADRVLKRVRACDSISPSDLPTDSLTQFDFGLAIGVAGEIPPQTLARMLDLCRLVFVDVQSLIRTFDPIDGTVRLVPLRDSGFFHLLPRIGFLKASAEEAPFVDVEEARKWCCVIVTDGKDGCRVYWKDGELQISPFPTLQIDPTGAGDSFLGGFVVGLLRGLTIQDAALLGNFFGSLTVTQNGVPKFDRRMLQKVKEELERMAIQCSSLCGEKIAVNYQKSEMHREFKASLVEAAKLPCTHSSTEVGDEQENNCHHTVLINSAYEVAEPVPEPG